MERSTLILNGSPRTDGDTAALIAALRRRLRGPVTVISAFRARIAPCTDCRSCWTTGKCAVRDDMDRLYADDFDNVVLAAPVWFGTFPGPVLSLMSRLQPWHAATYFLKTPLTLRPKRAALVLAAGGKGKEEGARRHAIALFKMLNASGWEDHTVLSGRTDTLPAREDAAALAAADALADWLNGEEGSRP